MLRFICQFVRRLLSSDVSSDVLVFCLTVYWMMLESDVPVNVLQSQRWCEGSTTSPTPFKEAREEEELHLRKRCKHFPSELKQGRRSSCRHFQVSTHHSREEPRSDCCALSPSGIWHGVLMFLRSAVLPLRTRGRGGVIRRRRLLGHTAPRNATNRSRTRNFCMLTGTLSRTLAEWLMLFDMAVFDMSRARSPLEAAGSA